MPARHPSLVYPLLLSLAIVAGLALAMTARRPVFQAAWTGAAGIVFFFALAALWDWWRDRETEYHERQAYTDRQTPFSNVLSLAAHLTPEQVAIVPQVESVEVVAAVGSSNVAFLLHAEGGLIPYAWIAEYLRHCGYVHLYPINRYPDKTANRRYAVAFTEWLIARQLAIPANGPRAAAWMDDQARSTAMRLLRVDDVMALQDYANVQGAVEREREIIEAA